MVLINNGLDLCKSELNHVIMQTSRIANSGG